jgi:hypothetical protein
MDEDCPLLENMKKYYGESHIGSTLGLSFTHSLMYDNRVPTFPDLDVFDDGETPDNNVLIQAGRFFIY